MLKSWGGADPMSLDSTVCLPQTGGWLPLFNDVIQRLVLGEKEKVTFFFSLLFHLMIIFQEINGLLRK